MEMNMVPGEIFLLTLLVAIQASVASADFDAIPAATSLLPRMPVLKDAPSYPQLRIIKGDPAKITDFPYQAGLILDSSSFCGGSLLNKQWILTAAHCAYGITRFTIFLGTEKWRSPGDNAVILSSTTKIVHSGYSNVTLHNDIALVYLPKSVSSTAYIKPVVLPTSSDLFVGKPVKVSGWGRTSDSASQVSDILNYVELQVINNTACETVYGTQLIRPFVLCTEGVNGKNVCNGDSGGPLVLSNSTTGTYTQVGIVSFVSATGCSGHPAGFARVTSFLDWIKANTE